MRAVDFFLWGNSCGSKKTLEEEGRGHPRCEGAMTLHFEVVESGWCLWLLLGVEKWSRGDDGGKNTPDSNHFHAQAPPICGSSPSVQPVRTIEREYGAAYG